MTDLPQGIDADQSSCCPYELLAAGLHCGVSFAARWHRRCGTRSQGIAACPISKNAQLNCP